MEPKQIVAKFREWLTATFQNITVKIDKPKDEENGVWYIDITKKETEEYFVGSYKKDKGYGFSAITDSDGYGTGCDHAFAHDELDKLKEMVIEKLSGTNNV